MGLYDLFFKAKDFNPKNKLRKWAFKKYNEAKEKYEQKKNIQKEISELKKKRRAPIPINKLNAYRREYRYKNKEPVNSNITKKYYNRINARIKNLEQYLKKIENV